MFSDVVTWMTSERDRPAGLLADSARLEQAVDAALAACDGDPRSALRALIVASAHLETRLERLARDVSRGYVRDRYRMIERAGDSARE
jgi:hypothetical protein